MPSINAAATGSYGTVSIGTTAALIVAPKASRRSILIQNNHATQDLYIGFDSSVTTSTGLHLVAGASVSFDDYNGNVYGIASGAATDVRFTEVG